MISSELIREALALSAATLHEAAGKVGALPHSIKPLSANARVCGRAFPVRCAAGENLALHHAIVQASAGDVIVADCDGLTAFGYWGDVMTAAALARGIAGLVITGGVRDSLAIVASGFPVFSGCVAIRGTGKRVDGGSVCNVVELAGVRVTRGDLVFGDADGVVVIPAASAQAAVKSARARDAKESELLERLKRGETTIDLYSLPALASAPISKPSRRSINVPGLSHGAIPIPAASRIGNVLATGGIRGVDPQTGVLPADLSEQIRLMFANLRTVVEAGGACVGDIIKVTVFANDPGIRETLNKHWVSMFPEEDSRPARHLQNVPLGGGMLVQCDALVVIPNQTSE